MKKWILLTLLLATNAFSEQDKLFPVVDFSGGLNSYYSSLTIADNEVKDALNVFFDKESQVVKRQGFSTYATSSTYSYDGAWEYTDQSNRNWLITRASSTIIASRGDGSFSVVVATVASGNLINAVSAFNNIYFVDQSQGVYFWNGTSTTYVTGSPRGTLIAEFRGRLFVAGEAAPNGNRLSASGFLDPTNWTTGSLATSPAVFTIGLNDAFNNISGIFSGYNDVLYVFKLRSIYGVYGFDNTDFQVRSLNREVGCIDHRSIQPYMGGLVFASDRGIEFFDGFKSEIISKKIKDRTGTFTSSSFSERSVVATTQTDFEAGASSPTAHLSFTISPNAVTVSSYVVTFGTTSLSSGTFNSTVVEENAGVRLATSDTALPDLSFETGATSWTTSKKVLVGSEVSSCAFTAASARTGSLGLEYTLRLPVPPYPSSTPANYVCFGSMWFEDASSSSQFLQGINLVAYGSASTDSGWVQVTTSTLASTPAVLGYPTVGTVVRFCAGTGITDGVSATGCKACSSYFIYSGSQTSPTVYARNRGTPGAPATNTCYLDDIGSASFVSTITSGTYTSPTVDTGFQYSHMQSSATLTIVSSTPTFEIQTSTNATNWTSVGSSTSTSYAVNRYVRYVSSFSVANTSTSIRNFVSFIGATDRSSGTYLSPVYNAPNLTSFGTFSATSIDNGGSHQFYSRSSTNSFTTTSSTPSWVAQTAGTAITASVGTYFQIRDDIGVTASTHTPVLSDYSIAWFEGTRRASMSSAIYDDRYYLSLSTSSSSSINTGTLVLSRGPIWSQFDIGTSAYVVYRGALYHGNNVGNGKFYLDNQGYNDDGSAINAYIRTKDFAPDGYYTHKLFKSFYFLADPLGDYSLDTSYQTDRQSTDYALSTVNLSEQTGTINLRLPVPRDTVHAPSSQIISFKFGNSVVDEPMKLYGGTLVYRPEPLIR